MADPQEVIRLGIIGCGRVAEERHLPALRRVPRFRVVATADSDRGRAERLADRLGAPQWFTDHRALLDGAAVEAVAVLTPTSSHAEISGAALAAGKHVLVEKPLALSLAECAALRAAAARSTARVVVGFNLRWHRLVVRARQLLQGGPLGRIKAIHSVYTHDRLGDHAPDWHRRLDRGGGVSFNEAVHHYDLWRHLTGHDVEQIYSLSVPSPYYEDETNVVAARLTDGTLATGVFSFKSAPTSEVTLYGDRGRLALSLYRFDGLDLVPHSRYPGDLRDRLAQTIRSVAELPAAVPILCRGGDFQATFEGLWRHFADCVRHGAASECTLEDGTRSVRVAVAAVESARSGRPVPLGELA